MYLMILSEFQLRLYVVDKQSCVILLKYSKYKKLKTSRRQSFDKIIFSLFCMIGFRNGGSFPENQRKSWKMKSTVPDLSESYGMYAFGKHYAKRRKCW